MGFGANFGANNPVIILFSLQLIPLIPFLPCVLFHYFI